MVLVDLIMANYWDVAIVSLVFFMIAFVVTVKLDDSGKYGVGVVLFAAVFCSIAWVVMIPYFLVSWLVDIMAKLMKK
ncbi:TMhelix containing protein [Vibrio phage 1.286.O._10N.286.55.C4]|nr:TMhelix containing protein [Vibrio phage 1.286.O._10N.286.55.C4]